MPVMENIQFGCAVCRIVFYTIYRRLCCKKSPPPRPEFEPVCIGLNNSGKSTLLSLMAGESTEDIQPTTGFIIKAIQFKDCILNVKEIGGGDKVRPFWKHYYKGAQAVIFVVDSASSDEELKTACDALYGALENKQLRGLPLLVLANCQDKSGARTETQLKEELDLEEICKDRSWHLVLCSKEDKSGLREGFAQFCTECLVNVSRPDPQSEGKDEKNRV